MDQGISIFQKLSFMKPNLFVILDYLKGSLWFLLKGLGNIVKMRKNGAKEVTSMLDVQLKIICKFEWKRTVNY